MLEPSDLEKMGRERTLCKLDCMHSDGHRKTNDNKITAIIWEASGHF